MQNILFETGLVWLHKDDINIFVDEMIRKSQKIWEEESHADEKLSEYVGSRWEKCSQEADGHLLLLIDLPGGPASPDGPSPDASITFMLLSSMETEFCLYCEG